MGPFWSCGCCWEFDEEDGRWVMRSDSKSCWIHDSSVVDDDNGADVDAVVVESDVSSECPCREVDVMRPTLDGRGCGDN